MAEFQVVTGAPFSGKGQFVRDEIARREAAGELGLVRLEWTALYLALFPGEQSRFRDEAVSDTGAPRLTSYAFQVLVTAIAARELRGYVLTQSPRQALQIAERANVSIVEVPADVGDIADRAESHMSTLRRTVLRAARAGAVGSCRKAALAYLSEESALVGRARQVRRRGRQWETTGTKRPFDRGLWERGLTSRGREALAELQRLGNPEPTPSDVMAFLLRNRVEG